MLIGQLIAIHNAAMECHRRAMIGEQSFEARRESLNQANKLSRTFAALTEALDRHRGKGQQHVKVEHVHVHQGGRPIVGAVTPGMEAVENWRNKRMHREVSPTSRALRCGARTRSGKPYQSPAVRGKR